MSNGTATQQKKKKKKYGDFVQNETCLLYYPAIVLGGIYPREVKASVHSKTCTWMFMATLSATARSQKRSKCPSRRGTRQNHHVSMASSTRHSTRGHRWYSQPLSWISRDLCWAKMPISKGYTIYIPLTEHPWNNKITERETGVREGRGKEGTVGPSR